MAGGISITSMVRTTVSSPPVFSAVTVYVALADTMVGVPLISPVEVSKFRPFGKLGSIDQVTTVPPVSVGVIVDVRAVSLVNV